MLKAQYLGPNLGSIRLQGFLHIQDERPLLPRYLDQPQRPVAYLLAVSNHHNSHRMVVKVADAGKGKNIVLLHLVSFSFATSGSSYLSISRTPISASAWLVSMFHDFRMSVRRGENLRIQHSGKIDISCVNGLAAHPFIGILAGNHVALNTLIGLGYFPSPWLIVFCHIPPPLEFFAASNTASDGTNP